MLKVFDDSMINFKETDLAEYNNDLSDSWYLIKSFKPGNQKEWSLPETPGSNQKGMSLINSPRVCYRTKEGKAFLIKRSLIPAGDSGSADIEEVLWKMNKDQQKEIEARIENNKLMVWE